MPTYDAVLFIGFGGPEKREDIRPFLEIVTRGRPIPPERIEEVAHHYEAIGGSSPINAITISQAEGLRKLLNSPESRVSSLASKRGTRDNIPVYVGNRNWHPFIEDALRQMQSGGVKRAIGFYTAAHRSEASLERYLNAVESARTRIGPEAPVVDLVGPWFDHPLFIEAITLRAQEALQAVPGEERSSIPLIFTAHSIPCAMAKDSTYVLELQKTAELIAHKLGRKEWKLAYSSRSGNPRDPWLEPDIGDEIRTRARHGQKQLLMIPIGFIADHVEILFDLDVEAQQVAREVGVTIYRAKTVGDHPVFCRMIADVVQKRAAQEALPEMMSSQTTRDQSGQIFTAPGRSSKVCYCQPVSASPPCLQTLPTAGSPAMHARRS